MFYFYVLISKLDREFYKGVTGNLERRLKEHNSGKVTYTKGHRPYIIYYFETFHSRKEANQGEKFFKSIEGYRWLKEKGITLCKQIAGSPEGTPLEESRTRYHH